MTGPGKAPRNWVRGPAVREGHLLHRNRFPGPGSLPGLGKERAERRKLARPRRSVSLRREGGSASPAAEDERRWRPSLVRPRRWGLRGQLDPRLGPGAAAGSLWERGGQVPRGAGGSRPWRCPRSPSCGGGGGGSKRPSARALLRSVGVFPPGAGRAGPLLLLFYQSTRGCPCEGTRGC